MNKFVALLLSLVMLLSLSSCLSLQSGDKGNGDPPTGTTPPSGGSNMDPQGPQDHNPEDEGYVHRWPYYTVEKVNDQTYKYYIYDKNGNTVREGTAQDGYPVSQISDDLLCIHVEHGAERNALQYYNTESGRFSDVFCNVLTRSEHLVAYLDGTPQNRKLVVRNMFDATAFCKEFTPDLASTEKPVLSAYISSGALYLRYNAQGKTEPCVTRLHLFDVHRDWFLDYGTLTELVSEINHAVSHFDEGINYTDAFCMTGTEHEALFNDLFSVIRELYIATKSLTGLYAVQDLNNDGTYELIFATDAYDVAAVFTTENARPVLLIRHQGQEFLSVDHNGLINASKGYRDGTFSQTVYQLPTNSLTLEMLEEFGYEIDDSEPLPDGTYPYRYFVVKNREKNYISYDEYLEMLKPYSNASNQTTKRLSLLRFYNGQYAARTVKQAVAREAYIKAIKGEIQVYDTDARTYIFLQDYVYDGTAIGQRSDLTCTMLDADRSGACELIIDCGKFLILHYDAGTVYLYSFEDPDLVRWLESDTPYYWQRQEAITKHGYNQLVFDGSTLKIKEILRIEDHGEAGFKHFSNGMEVEQWWGKDLEAYLAQSQSHSATFHPLRWSYRISEEEAWEIANRYWGDAEGETTGACGSNLTDRVLQQSDPFDHIGYYRFVLATESRTNGFFSVGHISVSRSVYVDVSTGECTPAPIYHFDGK